jgi:hypothetical protein
MICHDDLILIGDFPSSLQFGCHILSIEYHIRTR